MMPHTVPNRPRGRADRREHAGAARDLPADGKLQSLELQRDALLEPVALSVGRQPDLLHGRLHQQRNRCLAVAQLFVCLRESRCAGEYPQASLDLTPRAGELDRFRHENRPGHERREGKPDHDGLHHHVGIHEHAPRRKILGQLGAAHRAQARRRIFTLRWCRVLRRRDQATGL